MVKLVDTIDSKSIFRWESLGSSPSASTKIKKTMTQMCHFCLINKDCGKNPTNIIMIKISGIFVGMVSTDFNFYTIIEI